MPNRPASPVKVTPDFDLEQHAFFWLTQVIGSRDRLLARTLRPFGLRVPEWRAMAALHARRRCAMHELSELATIDRTTLSRTIDRMQQAGWVVRLSDSVDLRITRLTLSAEGARLFRRVWAAVEPINRDACADLPDGALDLMRWTLMRMKQNLDRNDGTSTPSHP